MKPRHQNRFWLGADLVVEVVSEDDPERDTVEKVGDDQLGLGPAQGGQRHHLRGTHYRGCDLGSAFSL